MGSKSCVRFGHGEAKFGFLCDVCWIELEQRLAWWPSFSGVILDFGRLVQRESVGGKSKPDGYTPLTQVFLDVDETDSYLRSLALFGGNARAWVSDVTGAADAVRFTDCAARAERSHELVERDGRLRRWQCPVCWQNNVDALTLWLKQPRWVGDERVISCMNSCGYEVSIDRAGDIASVEERAARLEKSA